MKGILAFQLVFAVISTVFAQAGSRSRSQSRSLSFPYFSLEIFKEPAGIDSISFGVVPDGQYEVFRCAAGLYGARKPESRIPYEMDRKECKFESENYLPIRVFFSIREFSSGVKKAGFRRDGWKLRDPLRLTIHVQNSLNPRNSYIAKLKLSPKFFTSSYDDLDKVYFHSSTAPEAAEVSF